MINIFDLKFDTKSQSKFLKLSKEILNSNKIAEGKFCRTFENNFSKKFNYKFSSLVGSGTDALEICFKLTNPKKKIILQANNFFAALTAVENANKDYILCDMELETLGICPQHLKKIIREHKNQIDSVCIVHTGGIISKHIKEIASICKKNNLILIEDSAHAHGSNVNGKYAGSFGDLGTFSFFPTKVMTTGEGGMIVTNNRKYYNLICSLKDFGRSKKDSWIRLNHGSNCKVTEFQAALGLVELERFNERFDKRNQLAKRYVKNLLNSNLEIFLPNQNQKSSFYKIIMHLNGKKYKDLEKFLYSRKISLTGRVWKFPMNQQPTVNKNIKIKNTDYFCKNHFCPPLYPELSMKDIDLISESLIYYFR